MGGCVSNRNDQLKKYKIAFTDKEFQILDIVFQWFLSMDQTQHHQLINRNGYLTHKSMQNAFKENREFSIKLHNWMKARSKNGLVDYETFVVTLELLLKEQVEYYLSDYKYRVLEKFELFALISLGCLDSDKETINRFQVSYSQGSIVVRELLNIFHFNKEVKNAQKNDLAARSVSNAIFDQRSSLPFNVFVAHAKSQLIYANKICKKYFIRKFLNPEVTYSVPRLDGPSFIFNEQIMALLTMSSPVFQTITSLQKVYASSINYDDFEEIASIIVQSKQPLLFIFRNREDESQNNSFQQQVFGAYVNIDPLIETHYQRKLEKDPQKLLFNPNDQVSLYFGDEKSFLFSIMPKYQVFMSTFGSKSKRAFGYLQARSFDLQVPSALGLGFGGDGKGNHRIWIDENIKGEGSNRINNYCDETYELGFILEPHIETINLTGIEIWSVQVNEEEVHVEEADVSKDEAGKGHDDQHDDHHDDHDDHHDDDHH